MPGLWSGAYFLFLQLMGETVERGDGEPDDGDAGEHDDGFFDLGFLRFAGMDGRNDVAGGDVNEETGG